MMKAMRTISYQSRSERHQYGSVYCKLLPEDGGLSGYRAFPADVEERVAVIL